MANNPYVNKVGLADGTTLIDLTSDTAVASDVAQGKYFHLATGERVQGTASGGGGGASNVVTGTFKGTTTGAAMDVNIPYTGTGYPVAVMIFPSATDLSTFNSMVQRYIIRDYFMDKFERSNAPSYSDSGNRNKGVATSKYKSSTSSATTYSHGGSTGTSSIYSDSNAAASTANAIKIRSATKMSVFIASTSYGFAANIEYTYCVIYSS